MYGDEATIGNDPRGECLSPNVNERNDGSRPSLKSKVYPASQGELRHHNQIRQQDAMVFHPFKMLPSFRHCRPLNPESARR
jgi:hypothetical protein